MKKLLNAITAVLLFLVPNVNYGQALDLGTAANYVLFTTNGAMTNSGILHLTHLTGNVGSNLAGSISGFGNVDGQMHSADVSTALCTSDLTALYSQISTATPDFFPSTALGNGDTLVAGVYFVSAAATLTNGLILNAQGNSNAIFIFQVEGSLSVAALSKVTLINGALACNVFWDVEGLVDVATGATLRGNFVAHNAAINLAALDTLEGRALSINGAVTLTSVLAYMPIGCGSATLVGPAAPSLASAGIFGVFSSIGAVTATPITYVVGDVGSNSTTTTGFDPLNVTGTIHTPPDAATASAASALTIIYDYLNLMAFDIQLLDPADFGYGLVLTPHTYLLGAATQFTDTVYLNAEGDANAVFVIQVNGAFTTGSLSDVKLINGTQAKNVYWLINGMTTIFPGSTFNGQIIGAGAITLMTGDTLNGRALTINGAIAINGSFVNNNPGPCSASSITGTSQICLGTTSTLADVDTGGRWSSSDTLVATIDSISGLVTGKALGVDTITYISSIACVATITITVNPAAGSITGPNSVCIGSAITLSDISAGGKWSSSDTLQSRIDSTSGIDSGILAGTPTISYILPTGCMATRTESVDPLPDAGSITGGNTVCVGTPLILHDITTGGNWSSSNARATVLTGTVTPVSQGIDTINYIVSNSCGADTATQTITINPLPNAGTITGGNNVCMGSTLVLNDITIGGTWSSSNASATVLTGTVTPVSTGIDTIMYRVTNSCGNDTATKIITINTVPNAGVITGGNVVCVASHLLLNDATLGGTWSSSNANASVITGTVTGNTAGIDTISYIVITACGADTATKTITVNPLPDAGTITGGNSICLGSTLVLNDITTGGSWSSSNARATVLTGTVTPVSTGIDTIMYMVTNSCGTDTATKIITINTVASAGTITGNSFVCLSFTSTLTDMTPGGAWSASNTSITTDSGVITGNNLGTDTIMYIVTDVCGSDTATAIVSVNPLPYAGVITGDSVVCVGAVITLTNIVTAGTWSVSNSNASNTDSVITGLTAGVDTVNYVDTNLCGTDIAQKSITINPLPNAGNITGLSSVCVGSSITLGDPATGGIWSSSNNLATISGSIVTGDTAGTDTIMYALSNGCGTDTATISITINPLPYAGTISGASSVCPGSSILLIADTTGGVWSTTNPADTINAGIFTGEVVGLDTVTYAVTNICGTGTVSKTITINPLPNAGLIIGATNVCVNSTITLTDTVSGGTWRSSNTLVTVSGGLVTGLAPGMDTITYMVTNVCGTDTVSTFVSVNPVPFPPSISTHAPASVCAGTMYQNFGTSFPPASGGYYNWTAVNATVWATSSNGQSALISFTDTGAAQITLTDIFGITNCINRTGITVNVATSVAPVATVLYFQYHFVCLPANEDSYQWGYDDAVTLDSTILTGEINQDYLNTNPDFANKYYWVMTSKGDCNQKTYLTVPTAIQNINADAATMDMYPNPANSYINIVLNSTIGSDVELEVLNMTGQKLNTVQTVNHKASIDVSQFPAGIYIVNCYRDGVRITAARFVKN